MMELGRKKEGILLLGIVLAALALRLTTYGYEYPLGIDPLHHYRIAEYLAEKGHLPVIWPLSLAPTGSAITEPAGFYYLSVLLRRLLGPLGLSFVQAFMLAPAIFGASTIVPAYLLARKVFDKRAALFSTVLLAFLPGFVYRAFAGFYRGDVFSVFFMLWGFYLFLTSLDGSLKRRIATSVLAGLSFGLMGLVWNGFLFGFGVLTLSSLLISSASYCRGRWSWAPLQGYILSAGLGILLIKYSILLYPNTAAPISDLAKYIYPGTVAFSGALGAMDLALRGREARVRGAAWGLLVLASAFILLTMFPGFLRSLSTSTSYGALQAEDVILGRISELRPPTLDSIWEKYNILIILSILGFLYMIKDFYHAKNEKKILFTVWALASILLLGKALRFSFLASVPLGILGGLAISRIQIPRFREAQRLVPLALALAVVIAGVSYASERAPDMDKDWVEALAFLKGQEPGVVLSWWNAGSWVQGATGFPTVIDSVHGQKRESIMAVGEVLLESNTTHIRDFLDRHGVRYIVVSSDLIYYLGDIQAAANASGYNYSVLYPNGTGTLEGKKVAVYGKERNFIAYRNESGIQVLYLDGNKAYRLERVHYREKEGLVTQVSKPPPPILEGGVYATKEYLIYATPLLEGTLLNSLVLLDGEGFSYLQQIYSNPRVRIYKVVPQ